MDPQKQFLLWNYSVCLYTFEAYYAIEQCFLVQSPFGCRLWLAICLSSQNPHARLAHRCLLSFDLRSVFVLLILSHTRSIGSKQSIRLMDTLSHFHTYVFIKWLHLGYTFACVRTCILQCIGRLSLITHNQTIIAFAELWLSSFSTSVAVGPYIIPNNTHLHNCMCTVLGKV